MQSPVRKRNVSAFALHCLLNLIDERIKIANKHFRYENSVWFLHGNSATEEHWVHLAGLLMEILTSE